MFKGTGTFESLVTDGNKVLTALENGEVEMVETDAPEETTLKIEGDGENAALVLNLEEAPIYSVNNVEWIFTTPGAVNSKRISLIGGGLYIFIDATVS